MSYEKRQHSVLTDTTFWQLLQAALHEEPSMRSQAWSLLSAPGNSLATESWILLLMECGTPAWTPDGGEELCQLETLGCREAAALHLPKFERVVPAPQAVQRWEHQPPHLPFLHSNVVHRMLPTQLEQCSFTPLRNDTENDTSEVFLFPIALLPVCSLIVHSHNRVSRGVSSCRFTGKGSSTLPPPKQTENTPQTCHH